MGKKLKLVLVAAVASLALVAAASAAMQSKAAGTTLVFGASADPVVLDGALVSDGESLRPISLIFQGLVSLKPGSTEIVPQLATNWTTSKNGLAYTFNLRSDVQFQDGTPFNAKAVCANFTRWYFFPAPLQSDAVSYYWNAVFQGFARPAKGNPGPDKSLYKGCRAVGSNKAIILLNRKSGGFLGALALSVFSIASPTALVKYDADGGTLEEEDDPLWHRMSAAQCILDGMHATTMAGVIALAEVARFMAKQPDGSTNYDTGYTQDYPERVITELLRLNGGAA